MDPGWRAKSLLLQSLQIINGFVQATQSEDGNHDGANFDGCGDDDDGVDDVVSCPTR